MLYPLGRSFTNAPSEMQGISVTCPKSFSSKEAELEFGPRPPETVLLIIQLPRAQ